ncbi:MAG: hypothetical protein ABSF91_08705 [Bacteroidota bacterium]|jgi:hypothetical protein
MKQLLSFCLVALFVAVGTLSAQGKFSGYMFGDYFYNIARPAASMSAAALSGAKDLQGFQFRRIYFTYDNDISDQFTSRFRLEADQSALTTGSSIPVTATTNAGSYQGKIETFVKDAYLKWKNVFEGSDFIFGIQPTTAFDISETWWGYRSIEKTIMDLRGIIPSRDFGVALRGKITEDGMFNYWAMIANGDGNSPVSSKFKRYSLNLQVKPADNWQATLNGDYRAQASIHDPTSTTGTLSNDIFTSSLFFGYREAGKYSLGAEAFMRMTMNGMTDPSNAPKLKSANTMGFSVFGNYSVQDNLDVVARYDYYDPNSDSNVKGDSRNYIIAGLNWKADKNVWFMPNFQIETYESNPNGTTYGSAVTGRVTMYYVFL